METVVYGIISEVFGVDAHEVNPETEFHQDHSANREATQRLQHQLNDQYVIQMSDEELVQIKTVHDAISQIKRHASKRSQCDKKKAFVPNMENSIYRIVADVFGVDPLTISAETHFRNDIGADKMDILKLIQQMNDEFQIEIPEEEMENFLTVQDAIRYIIMHMPS